MARASVELPESIRERLGKVTDGVLAIEAGVSSMTISRKRRQLGIPAASEGVSKPTTPKGTKTDLRTVARKVVEASTLVKGGFVVPFDVYMNLCKALTEEGE